MWRGSEREGMRVFGDRFKPTIMTPVLEFRPRSNGSADIQDTLVFRKPI